MITSKLALGLAATIAVVGATTAIITHQNTDAPASATPAAPVATAATPSPKIIAPQVVRTAQVVAPKVAPAPAGNKPATPNDLPDAYSLQPQTVSTIIGNRLNIMGAASMNTNGSDASNVHTSTMTSDGTTVTLVVDGVAQTVPAGTPKTVTDPATGTMMTFGPGNVIASGGSSGSGSGMVNISNGSSGSMSRTMKIVNGQMVVTTTKDGVTTTKTTLVPPSGSILAGSSPGEPDTMIILDQNGVAHAVPVPSVGTAHAVMITATPDGTNNVLQINPSPDNP